MTASVLLSTPAPLESDSSSVCRQSFFLLEGSTHRSSTESTIAHVNTSAATEPECRCQRSEPILAAHSAGPMPPEIGREGICPFSAGRGKEKLQAGRGRSGASLLKAAGGGYVGELGGELELNDPCELREPVEYADCADPALEAKLLVGDNGRV